jgi:hypothetical protein
VSSPNAGQITCFGDSWANFACPTLEGIAKLHLKANKVVNKGVPGSTAAVWASNPAAMVAEVLSGGLPSFMWLSIGGNDILDGWGSGACVGNATTPSALACYAAIYNATAVMLDTLFADLPLLQVVMFGYDFTNFVGSAECVALAAAEFHGDVSQEHINERFLAYDAHVLQPLKARYNGFSFDVIPLWGTLQAHGAAVGEPVPPPYPNVAYPSPPATHERWLHSRLKGGLGHTDGGAGEWWRVVAQTAPHHIEPRTRTHMTPNPPGTVGGVL